MAKHTKGCDWCEAKAQTCLAMLDSCKDERDRLKARVMAHRKAEAEIKRVAESEIAVMRDRLLSWREKREASVRAGVRKVAKAFRAEITETRLALHDSKLRTEDSWQEMNKSLTVVLMAGGLDHETAFAAAIALSNAVKAKPLGEKEVSRTEVEKFLSLVSTRHPPHTGRSRGAGRR